MNSDSRGSPEVRASQQGDSLVSSTRFVFSGRGSAAASAIFISISYPLPDCRIKP